MTDQPQGTVYQSTAQQAARVLREKLGELSEDWLRRARTCSLSGGLDMLLRQGDALEHFSALFPLILNQLDNPTPTSCEKDLKTWTNTAEERGYPLSSIVRACLLWKDTIADFFAQQDTENSESLIEMAGAIGRAIDEHVFLITDLSYHVASQVVFGSDNEFQPQHELSEYAAQLHIAAERRAQEIAALTRITTAISGPADLDRVFQIVAFELAKFFPFDRLAIMLKQSSGNTYSLRAVSVDGSQRPEENYVAQLRGSILEHVENHRQVTIEEDLGVRSKFDEDNSLFERGLRSLICVPLYSKEQVIGALHLASRQSMAYSKANTSLLQEIAEEMAVAVEKARLSELAQKRATELDIINQVGKMAVSTFDLSAMLSFAAESIQKHFSFLAVSLFLVDHENGEVVLTAESGPYNVLAESVYRQKLGVGMVGLCAQDGKTILANDVSKEPRRIIAFPGEIVEGSEICIPFFTDQQVAGVINVESELINAFDTTDVATLETVADLLSKASENAALYEETRQLKEFRESIIETIPSSLLVLDGNLTVVSTNRTFCELRTLSSDEVEGRHLREFFPSELLESADIEACVGRVLDNGMPITLRNLRYAIAGQPPQIVNFYMTRIQIPEGPRALLVIEDVTENVEGFYRLSILRQINEAVQGTLDMDKLLHLVLTCVTAGPALGFNRVFLLMVSGHDNALQGQMGVGPAGAEDAIRIWQDMGTRNRSLTELLTESSQPTEKEELPLHTLAKQMRFSLDEIEELPVLTIREKRPFLVTDAQNDPRVSKRLGDLMGANEFVSVPLVAKDEAVGVILADNLYSRQPLTEQRVEMLAIFANHAGLALENAEAYAKLENQIRKLEQAYQRLEETQDRLVRSEKLAAIGEMAAHVAHEIRNPLVTIGGFARAICRTLGTNHRCTKPAQIVVDEVTRLERILASVMDFTKPSTPWYSPTDINEVLDQTITLLTHEIDRKQVTITRQFSDNMSKLLVDPEQLKQAFLNILKNAVESLNHKGHIHVSTRIDDGDVRIDIRDTGKGMPPEVMNKLFSPFFTTKEDGTGLGLAVTQKIIENHNGKVSVTSKENVGTIFTVLLPVPLK